LLKKLSKWLLIVLLVAFVGIQFVRPKRVNPPINERMTMFATGKVPPDVQAILQRSCADCHSHATVWPWYSNVAPVSWLVAEDVVDARKEMNFSVWGDYTPKRAEHKLEELCEQVEQREMPLKKYTFLHPSAKLSDADRRRLCEWSAAWRREILGAK
jgi:hypothetical protein